MTLEDVFQKIREKRSGIQGRLVLVDQEASSLRKEDYEWAIAEAKLLELLSGRPAAHIGGLAASIVAQAATAQQKDDGKPDGIPTVLEMADEILTERHRAGDEWVAGREIARTIRRRWWPGVEAQAITAQLWRATKRGRYLKKGECYALPEKPNQELLGNVDLSPTPPVNGTLGSV